MTISPIGKVRAVVVRRDPEQEWFASVCRRSERRVHRRRPEECREAWKGAANTGERGDAAERRENRVRTPGANDDDHYTRGTAREVDLQLQRLVSSLAQLRGGGAVCSDGGAWRRGPDLWKRLQWSTDWAKWRSVSSIAGRRRETAA